MPHLELVDAIRIYNEIRIKSIQIKNRGWEIRLPDPFEFAFYKKPIELLQRDDSETHISIESSDEAFYLSVRDKKKQESGNFSYSSLVEELKRMEVF